MAQFVLPDVLKVPPISRARQRHRNHPIVRRRRRSLRNAVAIAARHCFTLPKSGGYRANAPNLAPAYLTVPQTTAQQLGSLIKSARDIMRKDKGLSGDLDRLPMLTWIMFLKFLDDMEQIA